MKNVILGIVSVLLVIYSLVFAVSILVVTTNKNRLDINLSASMAKAMERYYVPTEFLPDDMDYTEQEKNIKAEILSDMDICHRQGESIDLNFLACDLEKGIISVQAKYSFYIPTGKKKTLIRSKTILVDREE